MRKRCGFVSNSSSSSFIIALRDKPQSPEDLKEILFGDKEIHLYDDYSVTTNNAAKIIFEDLKESVEEKEILEELMSGCPEALEVRPKYPLGPHETSEQRKIQYEKYLEEVGIYNKEITESFFKKTKYFKYFIVEYSDNDGPTYCVLEHGDTFERVHHIRVNKH